jgi:hypothetical protein
MQDRNKEVSNRKIWKGVLVRKESKNYLQSNPMKRLSKIGIMF